MLIAALLISLTLAAHFSMRSWASISGADSRHAPIKVAALFTVASLVLLGVALGIALSR